MSLPFTLLPVRAGEESPMRIEGGFQIGNIQVPVLEYSSNLQGWSDALTEFHEEVAGENHPIDEASRAEALSQVLKSIHVEHPVILEIGCSSGYMSQKLQNAIPKGIIMAADIVTAPLVKLAKQLPKISCFRFDVVQCPLPDACVDVVIILNVLEHIENDREALRQIYRILKPKGVVIIEVPAAPHLYDAYDMQLKHYRRYSIMMLTQLIKDQGYVIKRRSHLGFFVYPFFAMVKKYNKRFINQTEAVQKKMVEKNINSTSNAYFKILMKIELFLGKFISYPFGIRCLMSCEKKQ